MKKFIIAIMVVMVAIGGMFIFKDKLEEAILNTGIEQALGTSNKYELAKKELEKLEGIAHVTYEVYDDGCSDFTIEYTDGTVDIAMFDNDMRMIYIFSV